MKYTLWKTGHTINDTVMEALRMGLLKRNLDEYDVQHTAFLKHRPLNGGVSPAISYGILRGTGTIFKHCRSSKKDFWEFDRGYFKPGHFDGYYRVSKNNTRCNYRPDDVVCTQRWDELDIPIEPWREERKYGKIMLCPPTGYVCEFFEIDEDCWVDDVKDYLSGKTDKDIIVRTKSDSNPLEWDLDRSDAVIVFNSNVAVEALQKGIKAYATHAPDLPHLFTYGEDYPLDREHYFAHLANNQYTLDELRQGEWNATT